MGRKYLSVTNGTFSLSETDVKNQFYFYRNDGGTIDVDVLSKEPMDLYQAYIIRQMMTSQMNLAVTWKDIELELSDDRKVILLTAWDGMTILPRFLEKIRRNENLQIKFNESNIFYYIVLTLFFLCAKIYFVIKKCGCGGTGRRAGLRNQCQRRGGSSPLIRTKNYKKVEILTNLNFFIFVQKYCK